MAVFNVPIINPTKSNVVIDVTRNEMSSIINVVTIAPIIDANTTDEISKKCKAEIDEIPVALLNITNATPNEAPEDIPIDEGDAKGFLNNVCKRNPATESEIPAEIAEIVLGILMVDKIVLCIVVTDSLLKKYCTTCSNGIETLPNDILTIDRNRIPIIPKRY
jgi:hypothetical protein